MNQIESKVNHHWSTQMAVEAAEMMKIQSRNTALIPRYVLRTQKFLGFVFFSTLAVRIADRFRFLL